MLLNKHIQLTIILSSLIFCVSCTRNSTYTNSDLGFGIDYPADWSVWEATEANTVQFGYQVTVQIETRQFDEDVNMASNNDALALKDLNRMMSVNLASGTFIEQITAPHIIEMGVHRVARMLVIAAISRPVLDDGIELLPRKGLLQINIIINDPNNDKAIIFAEDPDGVTDRVIKSFSFLP